MKLSIPMPFNGYEPVVHSSRAGDIYLSDETGRKDVVFMKIGCREGYTNPRGALNLGLGLFQMALKHLPSMPNISVRLESKDGKHKYVIGLVETVKAIGTDHILLRCGETEQVINLRLWNLHFEDTTAEVLKMMEAISGAGERPFLLLPGETPINNGEPDEDDEIGEEAEPPEYDDEAEPEEA